MRFRTKFRYGWAAVLGFAMLPTAMYINLCQSPSYCQRVKPTGLVTVVKSLRILRERPAVELELSVLVINLSITGMLSEERTRHFLAVS